MEEKSLYSRLGADNLKMLVENFYERVFTDEILSPLFNTDKETIKQKQYWFLTQFLGGPDLYSQVMGHPKLRARHMPHAITQTHAIAWLKCMEDAIETLPISNEMKDELFNRFPKTAFFMVNTEE